jgi:hypothetical protein
VRANCAPFLADILPYSYESEYKHIHKHFKNKIITEVKAFNSACRHTNVWCSVKSVRKTICVKFKVNIKKLGRWSCFRYGCYITILRWKIYNEKTEVASFFIESGRKLTICVKFKVNVKKWGRGSCFCCFFYLTSLTPMNQSINIYTNISRTK